MEDNNKNKKNDPQSFSESTGTELVSTLIFMVVATVIMFLLSKYLGN